MKIDQNKLHDLLNRKGALLSPDLLRREENVFFVGGNLPERETLETLYDSHFQSHAALFHLTFGPIENFSNGEALARMIKKNFHAHLLGRLDYPAPARLIERAYAAGVDIVDIALPAGEGTEREKWEETVSAARTVFPRWSVASTVVVGGETPRETMTVIDQLLALDVVPLLMLSGSAGLGQGAELAGIYSHLSRGLQRRKAGIKPLLPLIYLTTPLVPASAPGVLRGFIDIIDDRRLLAASDLRRVLRVKEVEESFESAGL